MKTKDLIKKLQEIDPSGKMEIVVNVEGYHSPKIPYLNINWIDKKNWEWTRDNEGTKCISIVVDK